MKTICLIFFLLLFMAQGIYCQPASFPSEKSRHDIYRTWAPWEIDSVLAAWAIKTYVNKDAQFVSIPRGTSVKSKFSIDIPPDSPYLRSAKQTAFEAVLRIHHIADDCTEKIKPIVRLLELAKWRKSESTLAQDFEIGLKPLLPVEPTEGNLQKAFEYIDRFCNPADQAPQLSKRVSFIGLDDAGDWQIYMVNPETMMLQALKTQVEPRNHSINFKTSKVCYIASDGSLREFSITKQMEEKVLLTSNGENAFAQPIYSRDGKKIFFVELKKGSSVDTDIWVVKSGSQHPALLIGQRSAQFEPYSHLDKVLFYSNVLCTLGCGKFIQEIWKKHLVSQEAEQVTLLNCISRQPMLSEDGKWLYFSSNKAGNYHIWRFSLDDKMYEQVTCGNVTDINPFVDEHGNLYFIRHSANGACLMSKQGNSRAEKINLPEKIKEIRDLRLN